MARCVEIVQYRWDSMGSHCELKVRAGLYIIFCAGMSMLACSIAVLALDIETSGPRLSEHEIISIGYCVGDIHGDVKFKGRIDFELSKPFDETCFNNFWSRHLDKFNRMQERTNTPESGIRQFIDLVDNLDKTHDLRIITDNPAFDIKFIDYYLDRYLHRNPLQYKFGTTYRPIYDTDSYSRGVLSMPLSELWTSDSKVITRYNITVNAVADHMPENDAEYIYKLHVSLLMALTT